MGDFETRVLLKENKTEVIFRKEVGQRKLRKFHEKENRQTTNLSLDLPHPQDPVLF